jgi:mercuric ion transport protein
MKTVIGSVFTATIASACCLGPVVLSVVGAGAFGAAAARLEPLRPLFSVITVVLLSGAFYLTYRSEPDARCETDGRCHPRRVRTARYVLWLTTVLVILILTFPYYMTLFV